jgi:predicted YcjX-like family ATPase
MSRLYDDKLRSHVKADEARRERLAAELRANLKKRKEKARSLAKAGRLSRPADADKT